MGTVGPFCLCPTGSPGVGMKVIFHVELKPLIGGALTAVGPENCHIFPATISTACGP